LEYNFRFFAKPLFFASKEYAYHNTEKSIEFLFFLFLHVTIGHENETNKNLVMSIKHYEITRTS